MREVNASLGETRAAVAISEKLLSQDNPVRQEATAFLAFSLAHLRRPEEAEPLLREAVAAERLHRSADRNQLGVLLLTLSYVVEVNGHPSEATALMQEGMKQAVSLNGPDSAQAAYAWNTVGNVRTAMNDKSGAEAAYRQSIAIYRRFTPARVESFSPTDNLAGFLLKQGRVAEAAEFLSEAEVRCREGLGKNNPTHGYIAGMLGLIDFLRQDYEKALPNLQHCLATLAPIYPKDDGDILRAKAALGLTLTRLGEPEAGEQYLREAFPSKEDFSREFFAPLGNLDSALGECLLAQQRYPEAEPLLLTGYNELKTRVGNKNPMSLAACRRLHEMYLAWDKPAEATRFVEKSIPAGSTDPAGAR